MRLYVTPSWLFVVHPQLTAYQASIRVIELNLDRELGQSTDQAIPARRYNKRLAQLFAGNPLPEMIWINAGAG
jgi:predicted signal transduction protein with EAL and GGDEF domain